jgi:hypothetical protein
MWFVRVASVAILAALAGGPANAVAGERDPAEVASTAAADGDSGAQDPAAEGQEAADLRELERQLAVLAEEIERLRSGETAQVELSDAEVRALGLAPSAASLYRQKRGVSLAGYGEMLYEDFASENQSGAPGGGARADFLRAILYAGYRFDERFLFNSEIEVEHADEIFVEFAYVDFLASDKLGIRAGMVLIPMGLVNEFHEPNVFVGARRPETEQAIIPSTWRENGLGVHGSAGKLAYRAYVVNGLRAAAFTAGGLRGGRQKGSQALADDLAFTARLDVTPTPGLFLGASVYTGSSGQGEITGDLGVQTTIFDVHGQAQARGFELRALYARAELDDAAGLNRALGLTGAQGVGDALEGGYVQVGYNVLSQLSATRVSLLPYYRFEKVDTQASMPAGFARSGATDRTLQTFGVELKPISNVVVKLDYQVVRNEARTGRNQFNLNVGYAF